MFVLRLWHDKMSGILRGKSAGSWAVTASALTNQEIPGCLRPLRDYE